MPGVQNVLSSQALHPGEFVLGMSGQGHGHADLLAASSSSVARTLPIEEGSIWTSRFALAIGLGHGLDGSLALPYYFESLSGDSLGIHRGRGNGDLEMGLKLELPWRPDWVAFSVLAGGSLPIASGEGTYPRELAFHPPESSFPSASTWPFGTVDPLITVGVGSSLWMTGLHGDTLRLHVNLQGARPLVPPGVEALGTLRAALAAEVPLFQGTTLEASLDRRVLTADPMRPEATLGESFAWTAALAWRPLPWLFLRAAGRFAPAGLNPPIRFRREGLDWTYRAEAPSAFFLGASLQGFPLRWDRDGDGYPDSRDRCPRRAEDKDGFQDGDGCPDIDNDRDGFTDSLDRCPDMAEDRDGFKDWDGCPDADNDGDGIVDASDRCAYEAEDKDGLEDADGCPELDDDRDGIPDAADRCPKAAETRNGLEDSDGCPEADADGDGKPDRWDRCPGEAEIVNFYQDEDGCADHKPEPVRNGILPGVAFLSGSSELLPGSFRALDSLASLLSVYPGTEIEIQGHLDDRSGAGAMALSAERARAVASYLAGKGVERRRMKPAGYGGSRPIDSNRTARGREANRRIEVLRLN